MSWREKIGIEVGRASVERGEELWKDRKQEAGTARRQGSGFRVQERQLPGSRKQEAGRGTPSRVIPAGATTHTRTHTTVIPAKAGIQVRSG
jgi:hypothetical protein